MDFDPDAFMQQTVDGPLETEFTLVPIGEYRASIGDFDRDAFEQFNFEYKKGKLAGTPGTMTKFTCPFIIDDDAVKAELQRDQVTISKQIILDLDANGKIAVGKNKNVDLGRIRDAVGQNDPHDDTWNVSRLRGAGPVIIKVVHTEFERKDGTKGKRAEVDRVARIV